MRQQQENERPPYATIQYATVVKLDISWAEAVLLDMVAKLSLQQGYCYKSVTSIARDMRLTFTGTKKMLTRLRQRELLVEVPGGLRCGQAYLETLTEYVETGETELSSKTELSLKNRTKFNETELSSDKNSNREHTLTRMYVELVTAVASPAPERVKALPERIKALRRLLKTFSYDEILSAATAIGKDAWLQGDNPQSKRYGDIDYLLRSAKQIDKYANLTAGNASGNPALEALRRHHAKITH